MKIAIMQPYFIPYAGYFRLFCATDLFVVYDCVQFPRRGWIHRNQLQMQSGELDWLTLPLIKQSMDVKIQDLAFRSIHSVEWLANLNKFPVFKTIERNYPELYRCLNDIKVQPVQYIVNCLREICALLKIPCKIVYSAELNLPPDCKGEERILAIVKHHRAQEYVNAPGGRELYHEHRFAENGVKLRFLSEFQGPYYSIIQCLAEQEPAQLREMLYAQSQL